MCDQNKNPVTATAIVFTPPPGTPTIRLTVDLTTQQAEDIIALCHKIGGHPDHTTRGVFDRIADTLRGHGVGRSICRLSGEGVDFK